MKEIGASQSKDFIAASNQVYRDRDGTQLAGTLTILDRIKLVATLAKSEVATLQDAKQAIELKSLLLPVVDQVCQQTELTAGMSDKGLFQCCLLVKLGQ